jgi:hypothetical protein
MDKPTLTLEDALVMILRQRAVEFARGLERFLRTRCIIEVKKRHRAIEVKMLVDLPDEDDAGTGESL